MCSKRIKNNAELIIVSLMIYLFVLIVPCTFIHEGTHYLLGLLDPNVDSMTVSFFTDRLGKVYYNYHDQLMMSVEMNELIEYSVSTISLIGIFVLLFDCYIRLRERMSWYNIVR